MDNVQLNPGTGGDTLAARDASGVKHQRTLVESLVNGVPTDVSPDSPLPVDLGSLEVLLTRLLSGAGGQLHDGAGRTRVAIEVSPSGGMTVAPASSAVWSVRATPDPQTYNLPAMLLRNQIVVT